MKLCILVSALITPLCAFAQAISDVSDLASIKITTPDAGVVNAGSVKAVMANYPQLATPLQKAIEEKVEKDEPVAALQSLGYLRAKKLPIAEVAAARVERRAAKHAEDKVAAASATEVKPVIETLRKEGFEIPPEVSAKIDAKIEAFRVQKEAALLTKLENAKAVKKTVPRDQKKRGDTDLELAKQSAAMVRRAQSKMEEYLAAGVPISQATQDAVKRALPDRARTPRPEPTPDDGL